ncbi:MAG: hypothetical protein Q8M11_20060 [Sulfuritalea sp.]|nr:hypothetical protein [Sulfuritalea sp.]MDP1985274.1 hypothetical protein [Sulfuritalea sp.]
MPIKDFACLQFRFAASVQPGAGRQLARREEEGARVGAGKTAAIALLPFAPRAGHCSTRWIADSTARKALRRGCWASVRGEEINGQLAMSYVAEVP